MFAVYDIYSRFLLNKPIVFKRYFYIHILLKSFCNELAAGFFKFLFIVYWCVIRFFSLICWSINSCWLIWSVCEHSSESKTVGFEIINVIVKRTPVSTNCSLCMCSDSKTAVCFGKDFSACLVQVRTGSSI